MPTYYVSTSGSDGAAGTSEGAAWLTIDKAMNNVLANDKVWVKADGNYNEIAKIDTAAANTDPIVFEGYSSVTGDNGQATIDGQSTRANCLQDVLGGNANAFYVFKNFRFTGATAEGVLIDGTNYYTFKNCKFDNNGSDGLAARYLLCEGCEFSSNGGAGCTVGTGESSLVKCKLYSNATYGVFFASAYAVLYCTFFSNAGDNIYGGGAGTLAVIVGCTIDGDAKDSDNGINFASASVIGAIVNNVIYDCTTGLRNSANAQERLISRNNLINANTTNYVNMATFTGEVTSAPQFTNEVAGADYTPVAGSPLINAGLNG